MKQLRHCTVFILLTALLNRIRAMTFLGFDVCNTLLVITGVATFFGIVCVIIALVFNPENWSPMPDEDDSDEPSKE